MMNEITTTPARSRRPRWMAAGLAVIVLAIGLATLRQQGRKPAGPPLPVLYGLTDFRLTNHLGRSVTVADLRGQISVVNVIFTRCPGPCLAMSRQFAKLQAALPADGSTRLLTLTIDPEFDTLEVLNRYGEKLGANSDRWWFLTGDLAELRRVAIDDFKFIAREKDQADQASADDLFIHSTYFMIVDRRARVRAIVESAEPGALEQTLDLVTRLQTES